MFHSAGKPQKEEIGIKNRFQLFCHNVDRGNIYSSDSTCSDKTLNIRAKTKV